MNDLCFNHDFTCLLVSGKENHRIYNCDPFGEFFVLPSKNKDCPNSEDSGTALLRMLFSTSLTIIVPATFENGVKSGGRVLKIFNLKQHLKICELTFPLRIVDVKLNRKRLLVFLEMGQIYLYDLSSIRLIKVLELNSFPHNTDEITEHSVVADLSPNENSFLVLPLLAISELTDLLNHDAVSTGLDLGIPLPADTEHLCLDPGQAGESRESLAPYVELTQKNEKAQLAKKPLVTLQDLQKDSGGWVLVYDTLYLKPRLIYKAHDSEIAKIAISSDSKFIATASTKGTIVRVSHVTSEHDGTGKLLLTQVTNLRRGHNPAKINALKFNLDLTILGCGSESGTVHLFTMNYENAHFLPTNETLHYTEDLAQIDDPSLSEEEPTTRLSSLEDLNENLANLLLLKETEDQPSKAKEKEEGSSSYFSAFKSSSKLLNNLYTKLIMKRLPYKQYFKNLIWEKPRRSFAYVKLPDTETATSVPKSVEIGFSTAGLLMLASYNSGKLYQFRMPSESGDERVECQLLQTNNLE